MPFVQLPDGVELSEDVAENVSEDGRLQLSTDAIEFGEDEHPSGYVTEASLQDTLKSRIGRAKRDTETKLLNSDEFFQKAASKRGIELRDDGRPKGSTTDEELKELRRKAAERDQLAQEAESLQEQIARGREQQLENQILKAADGVKDGLKDAFVDQLKSRFTFDESEGEWVLKDEAQRYTVEGGQSRLATPADLTSELDDVWFKDRSASGTGTAPSGSPGGKRTYTRSEAEEIAQRAASGDESAIEQLDDLEQAMQEDRITE